MLKRTIKAFALCLLIVSVFEAALFLCAPAGRLYQYWRGKAYPDNHVYQALVAANAQVQAGREEDKKETCRGRDVTDEFRHATAGEPFHMIDDEFDELGKHFYKGSYAFGKEYEFGLLYKDISRLKIPESMFYDALAVSTVLDFDVTIKYQSDSDYEVVKATVRACSDFI